ncbi:hypothetical protein GCM10011316_24450 [Roseibium aquae]|uniref:Uncharacterized protein n=1 Tax=Roseibium aquae TaxID=1323746 RepID=A0A916TLL2_9HYPH|nr:hypothetical protein [Roseibium aquae]GGB51536.1 hypothetical protein GCM10011316_24450 [Roseibium aquae]
MQPSLYAGLALAGGVLITASLMLWLYAGERVYVDRLLSAIAGCF